MSHFGQTLFGRGGFIRWALSPFVLLFVVVMPLLIDEWTTSGVVTMVGMEILCLALLAGFWLPPRWGHGAFRIVAGMVFLAYSTYLVDEFFIEKKPFTVRGSRSSASPRNALIGFLVIGLPCLWFACKGRFTLRLSQDSGDPRLEGAEYEAQRSTPDWAFYEQHLQRSVPEVLRTLYANPDLISRTEIPLKDDVTIGRFEPIRAESLVETSDLLGFDIVPIATSDCGDPIYLRPGPSQPDAVYITYHDGSETLVLFEAVSVLVAAVEADRRFRPPDNGT